MTDPVSPVKCVPTSAKRGRYSNILSRCIICQKITTENLTNATEKGFGTFLNAVSQRQDELYRRFVQEFDGLETVPSKGIKYHKKCYRSYTSKQNLQTFVDNNMTNELPESPQQETIQTRSNKPVKIDWSCCVFCKNKTFKKERKLLCVSSSDRLQNILQAATKYMDNRMIYLISNEKFINNALYHSACITKYLLRDKDVKCENLDATFDHVDAFRLLLESITDELLVHKRVYHMSFLLTKFKSFLPPEIASNYSTYRLQLKLKKHFGDSVVVETQQGQGVSNLVYSSSLSLVEAVQTAVRLKADNGSKTETLIDDKDTESVYQDDSLILHAAAAVIRKTISTMELQDDKYPSSKLTSIESSMNKMPSLITSFIGWLLDDESFKSGYKDGCNLSPDKQRKCLAISECIVSINKKSFTPFHLGLALHMHYLHGSKSLIETLNAHGFCASYHEVRRFLTSVASSEIEKIKDDTYIPNGIVPFSESSALIQEGADNVDINTETLDGKETFHSMARAVFQVRSVGDTEFNTETEGVIKGQSKSLSLSEKTTSLTSCLPYNKPKERMEPSRVKDAYETLSQITSPNADIPDLIWIILRNLSRDVVTMPLSVPSANDQIIPFWTGYNKKLSAQSKTFHVVTYPPIIDSKPNDMATVYTTMKRCVDMCKEAGQPFSIQTFDQQLYAIAQQVKWAKPIEFQTHILRLGGFHGLSCFIASIGKLWGDGGLRDLLVDSGVYAAATVDQMLCGKQFNRGLRGLTLCYEALKSLWLCSFFDWCRQNEKIEGISERLWSDILCCYDAIRFGNPSTKDNIDKLTDIVDLELVPLMVEFRKWGFSSSSTFQFWDMFLQATEILLMNIRAEREGFWSLHLQSVWLMLPYFFVANRTNYSRWAPVYLLDMMSLPQQVQELFSLGHFAIRQKSSSFNGIWSDMATEKTVIRDSKGDGGIGGMTRQKSSLVRWNLTRHVLGEITSEMKKRAGLDSTEDISHDEEKPTAMSRDERQLNVLISYVNANMTNPFSVENHPRELINISTGLQAKNDIKDSLLKSVETGTNMMKKFLKSSLTAGQQGSFYNPIQRSKLKTFEDMNAKINLKCRSGEIVKGHINPELVFRRALTLSKFREDVSVERVLSFPIGPIPTALFHDDGTMRKCNKSDLARELENTVGSVSSLPVFNSSSTVFIRDGMNLIQSLDVQRLSTFGDLVKQYIKPLPLLFGFTDTVVDVFDRYDKEDSIKSAERNRQSTACNQHIVYHLSEGRAIPDWKKFLSNPKNKQSLISFLGEYITDPGLPLLTIKAGQQYLLSGSFSNPEFVKKISAGGIENCLEMYSSHEEADTRMILHAVFADRHFKEQNVKGRIIIKCSDTDVLVLCVHYFQRLESTEQMWFLTGTTTNSKDNRRYVPIHEISQSLSSITTQILPAAHALTGCDTTCSLFGIGKKSVFKLLRNKPEQHGDLTVVGGFDSSAELAAFRKLIANLYDSKKKFASSHQNLNKLRVKLATCKNISLIRLPPSEPSLCQHVLRASIQTKIWLSSHIAKPPPLSPYEYGWQKDASGPMPVYFEGLMTSDFLQDLICSCKGKSLCSRSCDCHEQNLSCTELCPCQGSDLCLNVLSRSVENERNLEENEENEVE